MSEEPFAILCGLRDPEAKARSRRDRRYWETLYTDIHFVDEDHVALVFPAPDRRWRPWEEVRRG